MKTCIFWTIILVSTVTGYVDKWNLVHFSKSKEELFKCLQEETDLPKILHAYSLDFKLETYVVERFSHLLHDLTVPVESIDVVSDDLINYFGNSGLTFDNNQRTRVKWAILRALNKCSDPKKPMSIQQSSFETRFEPPRFVQEIPELAELLNMILVSPLYYYATEFQYYDYSTFSRRSLPIIEKALRRIGHAQNLIDELLQMWNRRARLFYDGSQNFHEFVDYNYHVNGTYVLTHPSHFIRRKFINYTIRNPPASSEDHVFEMESYHVVDWQDYSRNHVFSVPRTVSLKKSWYLFEKSKLNFMITLFSYLELAERGLTNKNAGYRWHPSFPKDLSTLLNAPMVSYGPYLKTVQRRELSYEFARNSPIFSSLIQSLQPGDNIDELDLLMMFWYRLRSARATITTTQSSDISSGVFNDSKIGLYKFFSSTTVSATTTFTSTSSTFSYEESKRGKGQVTRLPSGKFIPKNQRRSNDNDDGSSSFKSCKYFQCPDDKVENYDKYKVGAGSSELALLSENDMVMLEFLQDTFLSFFKSRLLLPDDLSCY